ncbi:coiled-coil domain-containing protein 9B isoform X1 [Pelobates fuscus]|uniref:coiled-coil domain-containing protein 9B isoform X1 n=2 Tax=Pelobates fuscus TaxID=191477 RepID=UPI002FE49F75
MAPVMPSKLRDSIAAVLNQQMLDPEYFEMDNGHEKDLISDGEIKKKEQKDVELDKRIQALRKKNEALIRRYQEIEEDRKNAEKEGMAITSRKPKQESLTITITKEPNEKRSVSETRKSSSDNEEEGHKFTFSMVNEMQLEITMDRKVKGRQVAKKKVDQDCLQSTKDSSGLSMEEVDHLFTYGRGRRMQIAVTLEKAGHVVNKKLDQDYLHEKKDTSGLSVEQVDQVFAYGRGRRMQLAVAAEKEQKSDGTLKDGVKKSVSRDQNKVLEEKCDTVNSDSTLTMAERERAEYLQWKKEREKIDLERIARHKNSRGEWRRAWDAHKTENMFENDSKQEDRVCIRKGDWGNRKFPNRRSVTDNKGAEKPVSVNEDVTNIVPAIGSAAKGTDRLTGRAQRWGSAEGSDSPYLLDELSTQGGPDFGETQKHSQLPFMERKCSSLENHDPIRQQRASGDKEKITSGSLKLGSCYVDSPLKKKTYPDCGKTESLEDEWYLPLQLKQEEKYCSGLPSVGIDTIEYLSVFNSDSEAVSVANLKDEQTLLVKEANQHLGDKSRDRHNKTQVGCF